MGEAEILQTRPDRSLAETRPAGGITGLVRNPLSRRNRKGGAQVRMGDTDILVAEPDTLDGLRDALRRFARKGVTLIIVDGGDGTVREVLTALPQAYGDTLPKIAVLASGTTNLIAADVGAGRSDPATIRMIAEVEKLGISGGSVQRRRTLEVSWPDGSRAPVHGMFFGAAAFTRATDISVRLVRQGVIDEKAGVAATLMAALAQTFAGAERDRWMQGDFMDVSSEEGQHPEGSRFVFLASTLEKLVLGVWPFWGGEPGASGVRYLDVSAPPKRLMGALPAVMRGRPRPWMEAAGYRSGVSESVLLKMDEAFIIDGEVFQPGSDGRVRLSAGPEIEFLVL